MLVARTPDCSLFRLLGEGWAVLGAAGDRPAAEGRLTMELGQR